MHLALTDSFAIQKGRDFPDDCKAQICVSCCTPEADLQEHVQMCTKRPKAVFCCRPVTSVHTL